MDILHYAAEQGFPSSRPDHPTADGPPSSPPRRRLNPLFVEWLMGWPTGLSGFARAETGLSPWLLRMRGSLWAICSADQAENEGMVNLL